MKRTTDAPDSQEKKQKIFTEADITVCFMEGPTTCGVVLNEEQKAQEKIQKNVDDLGVALSSHIETCTGKYFGNVPLPMVAELVRKGVAEALKISEDHLGEIIGQVDSARNADRPFYAVTEIKKTIGGVECSDKFIFSSLQRYRDAGQSVGDHKGKLNTVFYGPSDKAKFLADTTPEQRAHVDDDAAFFETMTEKYGAEFSMLGSGGFLESIGKLNAMCEKKQSDLSKKDLFILKHLAKKLNEAENE